MDRAEAEQAVQRFYEAEAAFMASETRDFSRVAATLTEDILLCEPASLPYGGEYRGHAAFEQWLQAFADTWSSMEMHGAQTFVDGCQCDEPVARLCCAAADRRDGGLAVAPALPPSRWPDRRAAAIPLGYGGDDAGDLQTQSLRKGAAMRITAAVVDGECGTPVLQDIQLDHRGRRRPDAVLRAGSRVDLAGHRRAQDGQAFADVESGETIKPVILIGEPA